MGGSHETKRPKVQPLQEGMIDRGGIRRGGPFTVRPPKPYTVLLDKSPSAEAPDRAVPRGETGSIPQAKPPKD